MAAPRALLSQLTARHASHALGLQRQRPFQPISLTPRAPQRLLVVVAGLQPPLTTAERKSKRAEAARLGKALVAVTLGQKGLSPTFLQGLAAALAGNELVKVRINTPNHKIASAAHRPRFSRQVRVGSDYDMKEVAEELERECDCVVVHKIGFVLTLYRDSKLAPPPCMVASAGADGESDSEDEEEQSSGKGNKKNPGGGGKRPADAPPEFTIL
jgi:RNA-binding protein YhbY